MFRRFIKASKSTEKCPPPTDLTEVFAKYAGGADHMTADQLHRFLVEYQGEVEHTLSDAEKYIQEFFKSQKTHRRTASVEKAAHLGEKGFSLDDLFHFLSLDYYNGPIKSKVHHDMNAPLSHYFMYTGHNSYLTGNQLSSDCSSVPIIKALQRGVRVIELDIWPNSSRDDVSVLHGRTLTTPVTLIQCLKSIKEYAFVKSPYPVIITLEDHLTPDLQAKVAEMITITFGDVLYHPEVACLEEFPSPESLKNRIIISTKLPNENRRTKKKSKSMSQCPTEKKSREASESPDYSSESGTKDRVNDATQARAILKPKSLEDGANLKEVIKPMPTWEDRSLHTCARNASEPNEDVLIESELKLEQKAAPQYKHLITIHAGKPKYGLTEALKVVEGKVRRLSLSEQKLEKAAETRGTELVRFTQKNILRIYPKGTRVTSSNFKPHVAWMHGAQMVAFNMQGYGKSLSLMHGMFRANGGCGYLKKPDFLMQKGPNNEVFDPEEHSLVQKTLKVKLYMGDGWSFDFRQTQFDLFSPPDFYTKVCIVGVPADRLKKKTKVVHDDWCPVWNEEFKFPLTIPELAVLRIEVGEYDRTEKDDFGGQTYLPVSELRHGFRSVPLYNKKGDKYNHVKLFMQFQFE